MCTLIHPGIVAVYFIAQLGSPSYSKREQATQALTQLAPLIVPYLESAKAHRDTETARRAKLILAGYYELAAARFTEKARPTRYPRLPWLDMLPRDYPDRTAIVEYFVTQARERIGRKGPPDWEDYRLATQLYLHHLFLNQQPLDGAIELLDRMATSEEKWITENGKNYSPQLKVPTAASSK
jgi:hypothetical protein